ncbi:aminodeoxychorismate synthase component I [uncultured Thiodictyon sp.]|uniref:aminodeoxychorismate synthase component I n=1 Tax=uncultured Thiodictyon sp. TaxID=1846217 RepID=UPI0025DDD5F2|nr:aminodeoxychorismate synthase component I [uncultured Thiodictyon sp.]
MTRPCPLQVIELPYRPDSVALCAALLDRPWPVFLDSGRPHCTQGRYDILSADPRATLVTRGPCTKVRTAAGVRTSLADPFDLLREALGPIQPGVPDLPFSGGAIGWFAYDLARRLICLPTPATDIEGTPDLAIGIYDWALVVDHETRRTRLVARDPTTAAEYRTLFANAHAVRPRVPFRVLDRVRPTVSRAQYHAAIARIQHYLIAGDCYQVNLAQRFAAPTQGNPWDAYLDLRVMNAAPYGAYLSTPDAQVLCSSPERFLRVRDGQVETKPIKGTRPRGANPGEDRRLAEALRASPKDRAEHLMIVDLLRNDLGRVCAIGSIQVPELFALESFAHVHHLVSTIRGRLAAGRTAVDLLRACFPGGSITGAPKRRAMEIIDELEPQRRGIYCGAIGYLGFDGAMDTNIAIRTMVHSAGITRLWAGGGIVADSHPESEYRETFDKAAPLLDLLEHRRVEQAADPRGVAP